MTTTMTPGASSAKYETAHGEVVLSVPEIKRYLCPKATEQEAYLFLRLCQAHRLNPFLREAYLIKYSDNQAATMVVGKDAFTQRAEAHPQFDGIRAGIIVSKPSDEPGQKGEELEYREGAFVPPRATLVGGWAEVYRKDRSYAFRAEVPFEEYSTGQSGWRRMPGTMIRKVALVQALREAFPAAFAGLYDAAEMRTELVEPALDTPGRVDAETREMGEEPEPSRTLDASARPAAPQSASGGGAQARHTERESEPDAARPKAEPPASVGPRAEAPAAPSRIAEAPQTAQGRDPSSVHNPGELFQACLDDFGMSRAEVLRTAGVRTAQELGPDLAEAYERIKQGREQTRARAA